MRIGIDVRSIGRQRTGDEFYTLNLVQNLARIDRNNKYSLYTGTQNENELRKIEERLNLDNPNFKIVSVLPAAKICWTFWSLPRELKKNPVDILHVQYITPQKLPEKTKLITTIHDVSFARYPKLINKKDLYFLKILIPASLKKADKIIAVSQFTKKEAESIYEVESRKVSQIYNGGAAERYFKIRSEDEITAVRKKYDLRNPFLFYVGTLQPRKNIPFLIDAFVKFKKEYKNDPATKELELVIGGPQKAHNYDQKINKVLERVGKENSKIFRQIKMIGYIDDEELPMLYQAAEIFCFPSLYEGFGLMTLESMASKTPVLCSNSSCFPEIVADAAVKYQENDEEDFVNKLRQLMINDELKKMLIEKGLIRARNFSWGKCAQETLAVYENLYDK